MLTIRLTRVGKKKDASFRVVVVDSKRKVKAGNYLEMVGSYDPRVDQVSLKADRIKHWMAHGAQTSDTVHNILVSQKIIDAKKINVLPKKTVAKKEEPVAEVPTPEAETPIPETPTAEDVSSGALAKEDNPVVQEAPADKIEE